MVSGQLKTEKREGSEDMKRLYCLLFLTDHRSLISDHFSCLLPCAPRRLALKMTLLGRSGVREFFTSALFCRSKLPR